MPEEKKRKEPGIAAVLSFLIIGLGQIYCENIAKGIFFFVVSILLVSLIIFIQIISPLNYLIIINFLIIIIFWIYNIIDAYNDARLSRSISITDTYLNANKHIESAEKFLAVIIISAIVLIVFAGTIARYIFASPLSWAESIATLLMVLLGFIGFQIATSKLRHIEIEFLKAKVKADTKYKMNIATSIIASVFLFIFFYLSCQYVLASKEMGDNVKAFEFPMWIVLTILPVSFFLSAIRFAFASLLWLDVLKGKRKESDIVVKKLL